MARGGAGALGSSRGYRADRSPAGASAALAGGGRARAHRRVPGPAAGRTRTAVPVRRVDPVLRVRPGRPGADRARRILAPVPGRAGRAGRTGAPGPSAGSAAGWDQSAPGVVRRHAELPDRLGGALRVLAAPVG